MYGIISLYILSVTCSITAEKKQQKRQFVVLAHHSTENLNRSARPSSGPFRVGAAVRRCLAALAGVAGPSALLFNVLSFISLLPISKKLPTH